MNDLGGGRDSLPCIVCEKPMRRIEDGGYVLQPDDGLHFSTSGAYGTTVFDPMDMSTLDVIVCDECIVDKARKGLVMLGQPRIGIKAEDGLAVGYVCPEREEVPWDPDKTYPRQEPFTVSDEEIVSGTVTPYAWVRADAIRAARERLEAGQ